jgi:hypothetical protein
MNISNLRIGGRLAAGFDLIMMAYIRRALAAPQAFVAVAD